MTDALPCPASGARHVTHRARRSTATSGMPKNPPPDNYRAERPDAEQRWFSTVEIKARTLIPIGYVGVVVSHHFRR